MLTLMIGLVIVAHGRLAAEFAAALEHIVGPQAQLEAVQIAADVTAQQCQPKLMEAVRRVDSGSGVIIASDLFGGTPCNTAMLLRHASPVEIICGVNLPMLVRLAKNRHHGDVLAVALDAQGAGRKYITVASQVMSARSGAA